MGLPGFLRGRRYVATAGQPKYFNFYETDTVETLTSPAYLARLDDPTPWTRRVVAQFQETSRTICRVEATMGCGEGGWIETIRLRSTAAKHDLPGSLDRQRPAEIVASPGVVGLHVLQGRPSESRLGSTETALRSEPDRFVDWVILVEAVEADVLAAMRASPISVDALLRRDAGADIESGICRLQFALTKTELMTGEPPSPAQRLPGDVV